MKRSIFFILTALLLSFFMFGCVAKSDYLKKVAEADAISNELSACNDQRVKDENAAKQKFADLQRENIKLKETVAHLQKKEVVIQKESETYKNLVDEMKGEIAKGQITITELKGKLTVDVVDKILFASGDATVKKEGLEVLKRVVEILKTLKDKSIVVEGHTDNVKIRGQLATVYPTNWELSAARAINVAKYLQQQGINPELLKAVACGEYKPIADNSTSEGRQKNRRIAIVLATKD